MYSRALNYSVARITKKGIANGAVKAAKNEILTNSVVVILINSITGGDLRPPLLLLSAP